MTYARMLHIYTTVLATAVGLVFSGIAAADGDLAAEVSFDPRSEVVFKVLYASNSFVLDASGLPSKPLVAGMHLSDTSIAVDLAGNLFVELVGRGAKGHIQVLENSTLRVEGKQIKLASGEAVFASVEGAELSTTQFKIPSGGNKLSAYLFFRGDDSFLSLNRYSSKPIQLISASGENIVVNPGQTARASSGQGLKVYGIIPKAAAKAMRRLPLSLRYLQNPMKSSSTVKIVTSVDASIAVRTSRGMEFRPLAVGETFVVEPDFAGLLVKLNSSNSTLAVEHLENGEKILSNYSGPVTMILYENRLKRGSER